MTGPLEAFRHLFARLSPGRHGSEAATAGQEEESSSGAEEYVAGPAEDEPAPRSSERREIRGFPLPWREEQDVEAYPARERDRDDSRSPRIARHVSAYLNARAGEALALLLEELAGEMAREMGVTVEKSREALSDEIGGVRETMISSQRELSRLGRELVRTGASLESIREAVSALGPAMERVEGSLRTDLMQEQARERMLREQAEQAALDDLLATLDGLEAGMEHARELVRGLSEAQRRLKDATVQRWWRAMGEATGAKRPLPEVPVAELEGWMGGLELTHRRLQDALARRGVTPTEAVGKPFDPYLHEAVAVEPGPEERDGLVLREERRGYRTSDRVIRLSHVVVGRAEPSKPPTRRRRQSRASEGQPNPDQEPEGGSGSGQPISRKKSWKEDTEAERHRLCSHERADSWHRSGNHIFPGSRRPGRQAEGPRPQGRETPPLRGGAGPLRQYPGGHPGSEPVGGCPRADRQVHQAQDGLAGADTARRAGVLAPGDIGLHPAGAEAPRRVEPASAGSQGGDHGAGPLHRRSAPGDQRRRGDRRPRGGADHQRADGGGPCLWAAAVGLPSRRWCMTWAVAPSTSRPSR